MKISYQWLQDFVELESLGKTVQEMAAALTMLGFNVEEIEQCNGDHLLDVEVTTNRPDCLNHVGIAREVAAYFRLPLRAGAPGPEPEAGKRPRLQTRISIEERELCPRYSARVMTGVQIGESPAWLRRRLESANQRPINNVVDITNYVMLEVGQPLHAFDYEKLEENRIVVRRAREGESLWTLDGTERQLSPSMLAICDARRPVALAGIMGGEETEVSTGTQTVLLESAYFDPAGVRGTAKMLGLSTEASFRFERGTDPEMPVRALQRVCHLLQELAGAVPAGPLLDEYPNPVPERRLRLRSRRIAQVVGLSVEPDFVEEVLGRLEFRVRRVEDQAWQVQVPTFRQDVSVEDDLVEEVARYYGYDRIESSYPPAPQIGNFLATRDPDRTLIRTLVGLGFLEAINYVFTNPAREGRFRNRPTTLVAVSNPLTEEDTHLRTSLVPGLLDSVRRNLNHGNQDIRLFEFGKVFAPGSEDCQVRETARLALIASGTFYHPFWDTVDHSFSFHHLKGVVEALLQRFGLEGEFEAAGDVEFLHPGLAARLRVQGTPWGVLGQLHPRLEEEYRFRQAVLVAELELESLYGLPTAEPRYQPLGRFPSVQRDLSFLVDNGLEYGKILAAVEELQIADLQDVRLIDLYQGPTLPPGKVSLAIRLTFAHPERTLTQDEVSRRTDRIFSVLREAFSIEGRS